MEFVPTKNGYGFSFSLPDRAAIDFISTVKKRHGKILEIAAGHGLVTQLLAAEGMQVWCNDLDNAHLDDIRSKLSPEVLENVTFIAGDILSLTTIPDNSFDYIFASRVMHFFDENQIKLFLTRCKNWLKHDGMLFVTAETPFLGNWKHFRQTYEIRKEQGEYWPGLIHADEIGAFETAGFSKNLPKLFNFFDEDIMRRELIGAGFHIEKIEYIDRKGELPPALLLDGKESVVGVGIKQ